MLVPEVPQIGGLCKRATEVPARTKAMADCHVDFGLQRLPEFLYDYVAARRAGLHRSEQYRTTIALALAKCLAASGAAEKERVLLLDEFTSGLQLSSSRERLALSSSHEGLNSQGLTRA